MFTGGTICIFTHAHVGLSSSEGSPSVWGLFLAFPGDEGNTSCFLKGSPPKKNKTKQPCVLLSPPNLGGTFERKLFNGRFGFFPETSFRVASSGRQRVLSNTSPSDVPSVAPVSKAPRFRVQIEKSFIRTLTDALENKKMLLQPQ